MIALWFREDRGEEKVVLAGMRPLSETTHFIRLFPLPPKTRLLFFATFQNLALLPAPNVSRTPHHEFPSPDSTPSMVRVPSVFVQRSGDPPGRVECVACVHAHESHDHRMVSRRADDLICFLYVALHNKVPGKNVRFENGEMVWYRHGMGYC